MQHSRRHFLKSSGSACLAALALSAGALPRYVFAAEARPAFNSTAIAEALNALGLSDAQESSDIAFKLPEIAENGGAVPVEIESKLANTRSIAILVEKNPHVMSAQFAIPEGTEPFVSTRIKVAESSLVHVVVKTDTGTYFTTKMVKVTLGGCGG